MESFHSKICTTCGIKKPLTTEYFNFLSQGYWRGSCKECRAAVTRKHHAEKPEMKAKSRAAYKERKQLASGSHTKSDERQLRIKQNDCCAYCGNELNGGGELDHRTSLINGGTDDVTNLAWACRTCNRDKGSKDSSEFLKWRKKLGLKIAPRLRLVKRITFVKKDS